MPIQAANSQSTRIVFTFFFLFVFHLGLAIFFLCSSLFLIPGDQKELLVAAPRRVPPGCCTSSFVAARRTPLGCVPRHQL
uniref:Uncharacterized protein n=1 Tax=Arundo donax TaxID=35708 RepID=A0A0A8Y8U7_ARUDO